jgi:6-phosphogluconolactonase (cycloisomerase 2 family)
MKLKKWARVFLAVAPVLAGCKGFWDVPSGSGGGNGSASGVFYVLNQKTSEIAGYSFASGSTTPTAITGSPKSLSGVGPQTIAISPNGGFLYVASDTGIYGFSINASTGELTALASGQALVGSPAFRIQVDPSGNWLIIAQTGLAQLTAIQLDPTSGTLLNGGTTQTIDLVAGATAVQQIAVTPNGSTNPYVFVALGQTGVEVVPLTPLASTATPLGTPKLLAPLNVVGGAVAVAVDVSTTRPLLYVAETAAIAATSTQKQTGGLRVFTIGANSTLTEFTGSGYPYPTGGTGPSAILPTSSFVYVANKAVSGSSTGNIVAYAITTTGTAHSLTAVTNGTIAAGVSTAGLAEESKGTYILAVNSSGGPDLNAYTIDSTTGALKSYATASTGSDPTQPVAIVAQ